MSRRGRDGRNTPTNKITSRTENKRLCCAICGLPFLRERIQLWLMELHFQLWHDTDKIEFAVIEKNTPLDVPEPIDMATSNEILQMMEKLGEAVIEARQTIAEAHSARKELVHAIKDAKREIAAEITQQVTEVVQELGTAAQEEMRTTVGTTISRLEADWRAKLGLVE